MHQSNETTEPAPHTGDATFQVVLQGIQPNILPSDARPKLAVLFKMTLEQIDNLLALPRYVLKKSLALDVASRYKSAIEDAGGICEVVPDATPIVSLDVDFPQPELIGAETKRSTYSDQTFPASGVEQSQDVRTPPTPETYPTTWRFFFVSGPGYFRRKPSYWIAWIIALISAFIFWPISSFIFVFLIVAQIYSRVDWKNTELRRSILDAQGK